MLKLKPNPTFTASVSIPVPGEDPAKVSLVFKHMSQPEFTAFMRGESAATRSDLDTVMAIVVGWSGVEAEFSRDAMRDLLDNYHGAGRAISERYAMELVLGKQGN